MAQLLGRARIRANGKELLTLAGSTLKIGGEKRTAVVGALSVHGHTVETVPPMLSCKITQAGDITVDFVDAIKDATILWEGDDGRNYVITGGFCEGDSELAEKGGEISASFSGMSCKAVS